MKLSERHTAPTQTELGSVMPSVMIFRDFFVENEKEITADSTPEYDIPFFPFDEAWDCGDWLIWHKKMKEKYGQQKANERFLEAWQKQSFWEWNQSFCKYNDEFVEYFKKQGLDGSHFLSTIVNNLKDSAENASEGVSSITAGLGDLSLNKVLIVGGAAGAMYLFAPQIKNTVQDLMK